MDYTEFSEKMVMYCQTMNFLYQEQVEHTLLTSNAKVEEIMKYVASDVMLLVYTPFVNNTIQPLLDSQKNSFDARATDLETYVHTLHADGLTQYVIDNFETYKEKECFKEANNLYDLHYIINYYCEMIDFSKPECWIYDPVRFAEVDQESYKYFEIKSKELFNSIS